MMAAREFSIPARDLDAAGKRFRLAVRASWLRGILEDTGVRPAGPDGELDLRLSKSGTDVVVRGTVTAELNVLCARCLQPAHVVVREPLSALVVPAGAFSADSQDADEMASDEAGVMPYDGETVVLDDLVRDELLLGIPMIPLCSESCPGIRPQTTESASPSLDPRFRPLLHLKKTWT